MAIDPVSAFRNTAYTASSGRLNAPLGARNSSSALGQAQGGGAIKNSYQELEDYVKMTPAQRMRVDLLKKLGLSEEDLNAMSPEERQGVETKLREMIQQQMQEAAAKQQYAPKQVGQWIDTTA